MKFLSVFAIVPLVAMTAAYPQPLEERQLGASVCIDTSAVPLGLGGILSTITGLLPDTGILTLDDPCPTGCTPALDLSSVTSIIDGIPLVGDVISGLVGELPLDALEICT